jgi:hypothetical protein
VQILSTVCLSCSLRSWSRSTRPLCRAAPGMAREELICNLRHYAKLKQMRVTNRNRSNLKTNIRWRRQSRFRLWTSSSSNVHSTHSPVQISQWRCPTVRFKYPNKPLRKIWMSVRSQAVALISIRIITVALTVGRGHRFHWCTLKTLLSPHESIERRVST